MGVTAVTAPAKGGKKTNAPAKVKAAAGKKVSATILTSTTTTTTTKISIAREPLSAPVVSGKSARSRGNPKGNPKGSTKTGAKSSAATKPKTVKVKAEVAKPKRNFDTATPSVSATKTSVPRMQETVKKMITEAVTREVKNGINLGQLTVTTTITMHPDQAQFLGSTMAWDYKGGPLKTVLKEAVTGEYKKKRYKIVLLSMSYVRSGGGYLKITITYKRS